jgi:hypothetical protein
VLKAGQQRITANDFIAISGNFVEISATYIRKSTVLAGAKMR